MCYQIFIGNATRVTVEPDVTGKPRIANSVFIQLLLFYPLKFLSLSLSHVYVVYVCVCLISIFKAMDSHLTCDQRVWLVLTLYDLAHALLVVNPVNTDCCSPPGPLQGQGPP